METLQQPSDQETQSSINSIEPTSVKTHRNDALKIIALLTMLIDHVGYLFFPDEMLFRTIGRIAFPIFAYQIAIGFQKTSSRKNYALRLFGFACLSQIPYFWFNPELIFEFHSLNIMFTFLLALGVLQAIESSIAAFNSSDILKGLAWSILGIAILIAPEVTRFNFEVGTEYGMTGMLFVVLFYCFGSKLLPVLTGYAVLSAVGAYYSAARWYHFSTGKSFMECLASFKQLWEIHVDYNNALTTLSGIFFQSRSIMAVPIILGMERMSATGRMDIRLNRYVGYFFYPVHIALLLVIKYFMVQ